jgi:uncharacterized protein
LGFSISEILELRNLGVPAHTHLQSASCITNRGFALTADPAGATISKINIMGETNMSKTIFISLPVADLNASIAFYKSIGFVHSPQFSDDTAAYMVWSETINVMLLTHAKWRTFTTRPIPPSTSSEVALGLSCESREAVDAMNAAAAAAANGGTGDINPIQDHGSMYGRDMADPDGHIWGAMWMDPTAMPAGNQKK